MQLDTDLSEDGHVWHRYVFESTSTAVRSVMADLRDKLDAPANALPVNPLWEVVLAETLNNIVEHAYLDAPDGKIEVRICVEDSTIHASFLDYGRPMPNGAPPEGNLASLDVATEDLPEGGFGWFLIRTNTRNLDYRYDPVKSCNRLSLEIPLKL